MIEQDLFKALGNNGTGVLEGHCRIVGLDDNTRLYGFEKYFKEDIDNKEGIVRENVRIRFSFGLVYLGEYKFSDTGTSDDWDNNGAKTQWCIEIYPKIKDAKYPRKVLNVTIFSMKGDYAKFFAVWNKR